MKNVEKTLIKISELKSGDVFLTKTSKLLVFGWRATDDTIVAYRYADEYYTEVLKNTAMVYMMENL
jgi:hypothetical protein